MFRLFKSRLILIALSIFTANTQAQVKEKSVLYSEVEQAHINGVAFTTIQLFSIVTGNNHNVLLKETQLQPETDAVNNLHKSAPQAVALTIKSAYGDTYILEMIRSNPFSSEANIGYYDANGAHSFAYDKGVHYQGAVKGAEKSLAALSVFANGDVMILFANDEGNFVIGKLEDNSNNYILYNDKDFTITPPTICGTTDKIQIRDVPIETGEKTTTGYRCKKIMLYWEVDYELFQNKQSSTLLTQGYITGLFNQVQTLYRNERVTVELKSVFIWTVNDGYFDGSSVASLNDFRTKWNNKSNNFDGDLAMLLAQDAGDHGGIAYRGGMCSGNFAYAYGDINGSYSAVPTYSWDVSMVTHEIGHNLGSPHTHWCGWNTGIGGACGAIDNCIIKEPGSNCDTCSSTSLISQPSNAWQGTIMSYCHLVSRGVNLTNGFGPLPGALIRQEITSATCLSAFISADPADSCKSALTSNRLHKIPQQFASLYPNPAYNTLLIKFISNNATDISVKITDLTGRTIKTMTTQAVNGENNLTMDVAGMQAGMYYVLLSSPSEQYISLKLVVE